MALNMFHTHSPYSPFFTSGLLSAGSRPHSPDVPLSPRRGSLPTSDTREQQEDASAFYFTLQPRRDEQEFRSFLSLDLAESQSMRSASLKRKASSTHKPFRFPNIPEVPMPAPKLTLAIPAAPAPLRMRFSRDSLRTIPSPKPAPSITLPDLPKISNSPPRLPSIQLTPSFEFPLSMAAPRKVSRLRLDLTTPAPQTHRISVATTSTVSTRAKNTNRSDALARLEGRIRPATAPATKRNFMSMSDDEDSSDDSDADGDNIDDDLSDLESLDFPDMRLLDPLMEPEDMVLPLPSPPFYLEAPRSAPLPPRAPASPNFFNVRSAGGALRRQKTRRGKETQSGGGAKDWFPLKSFIDLHGDSVEQQKRLSVAKPAVKNTSATTTTTKKRGSRGSATWSWRSFIEVANVVS